MLVIALETTITAKFLVQTKAKDAWMLSLCYRLCTFIQHY